MASGRNPFSHLSCAALSDVGRKRKNNEDSAASFPSRGVWCVADGMGGGDDGEVASHAVVRAIAACLEDMPKAEDGEYPADVIVNALARAIDGASAWIFDRAADKGLNGCGSTVVGVVFDATCPGSAIAFHVGDSRLYRLRGRDIQQITRDHSVEELMGEKDGDHLNPMFRGMILRAVGVERSVEVELTKFSVRAGDVLVVCTDGLTKMLPDKQIGSLVRDADGDMEVAAKSLVKEANAAGGSDNITVSLVQVGKLPSPCTIAELPDDGDSSSAGTAGTASQAVPDFDGDRLVSLRRVPWLKVIGALVACGGIVAFLAIVFFSSGDGHEAPLPSVVPEKPSVVPEKPSVVPEKPSVILPPPVATSVVPSEIVSNAPLSSEQPRNAVQEPRASLLPKEDGDMLEKLRRAERSAGESEIREEQERQKALALLKAERNQRIQEENEATERDKKRIEDAQRLSAYYYRDEFTSFCGYVDRILGRGASTRLQSLGKVLYHCKGEERVCDAAAELGAEARSLAARIVSAGDFMSAPGANARISEACRALCEATSPDASQRALLAVLDAFSNRTPEANGRIP